MYRGKRLFDLTVTLLLAPVWLPVTAVLALLVRLRFGSPVLFRQKRIGLGDREFTLLKFRTMTDAVDSTGRLRPDEERLPPFGRRLRSTSLDELPELFNVLKGEMSLVGPRPLLTAYLPRYSAKHRRRHATRPGLTGLAQVRGRNAITWSDRFDLDVDYVDRASPALDLRILVDTVAAVISRRDVTAAAGATMPEFLGYDEVSRTGRESPR